MRAQPALSLHGCLLSYYPHIKFSGVAFDNRIIIIKHFEQNLERCTHTFSSFKDFGQQKVGSSTATILQIYKQCVRPIFEYGIIFTITVWYSVIDKIQRVH